MHLQKKYYLKKIRKPLLTSLESLKDIIMECGKGTANFILLIVPVQDIFK